jgi:hypothetical protein
MSSSNSGVYPMVDSIKKDDLEVNLFLGD